MNNGTKEIEYASKLIFNATQDMQLEMNKKCRASKTALRPLCTTIQHQTDVLESNAKALELLLDKYQALVKQHELGEISTRELVETLRQLTA